MPEPTPLGLAYGEKANGRTTANLSVLPKIWTASELVGADLPDQKWAVPGLLPEGLTFLVGAPKIGKSWFCLGLGIAISRGGRILGQLQVEQGGVLYLALEDRPARLKKRLKLLGFEPQPNDPFEIATDWKRIGAGGLKQLGEWLSVHPNTRLVIVDTLSRIRSLDDKGHNVFLEEYKVGSYLKKVADDFGIALLVVHHLRKMKADDPLETVSGTFGLTAASDGALIILRARGEMDAILWVDGRDIPEPEKLAIKFDKTTVQWVLMGNANAYQLSKERKAILEALKAQGTPMYPRDVAPRVEKPIGVVKGLMWQMYQDGQLKNDGEGRYYPIPEGQPPQHIQNSMTVVTAPTLEPNDHGIVEQTRTERSFHPEMTAMTGDRVLAVTAVSAVCKVSTVSTVISKRENSAVCIDCDCDLPEGWEIRCGPCWELLEAKEREGLP